MIYVNVYVGQTRAKGWIRLLEGYGFGEMVCRGELPNRRHPWAFDNGAFKDWTAGQPFNVKRFEQDLDTIWLRVATAPDFIVAPDIVAGGLPSLELSRSWLKRMPKWCPTYLVMQDGMTPADITDEVLDGFGGLFVGGTLPWKLRTAREWISFAHSKGLKCHVGRMGTEKRVRAALRWGADSIDSALPLWSRENLESFLRGFRPTGSLELPLEAT